MAIHESKVEGVTVRLIGRNSESAFLAAYSIWGWFRKNGVHEAFVSDIVKALESEPGLGETNGARDQNVRRACEPAAQVGDQVLQLVSGDKQKRLYQKTKKIVMTTGLLENFVADVAVAERRPLRVEPITTAPQTYAPAAYAAPITAPQTYAPLPATPPGYPPPTDMAAIFAAMRAAGFAPNPAPAVSAPAAVETPPPAPVAVAAREPLVIPERDELTRAMIDILATDEFRAAMVATIANVEASKWFWNHMRLMIMEKFDLDLKEQTARALTNRLNLCVKETWDTLDADIKERIDHEFKESQLAQARAESAHLKVDSLRADLRPTIDGLRATTDALRIQVAKLNEIGVEPRLVVLEDHLRQAGRRLLALETGALS